MGQLRITSSPGQAGGGRLRRFAGTLLAIVVILLVFGFFAVRTETARRMIQARLAALTGMEVTVGKTRIGMPYTLVVENVEGREAKVAGVPPVTVRELRIGFSPRRRLGVSVRDVLGCMKQDGDGNWWPAFLKPLGGVSFDDMAGVTALTESWRGRISLRVREGRFVWRDSMGADVATVEGLSFDVVPVNVPGRETYHYALSVSAVKSRDGNVFRDVRREWLATEQQAYIEVDKAFRAEGEPDAAQ
jgi:hypothetical protein